MRFAKDWVLYEEVPSQSGPSLVSSSFCPDHARSRWECGCAREIYTPNTSPPTTQGGFRLPDSSPTTDVSQDVSQDFEDFLDLDQFAELENSFRQPEPAPGHLLHSAPTYPPVALPFTPYHPIHAVPTSREERIQQVIGAIPATLENPGLLAHDQYTPVTEGHPSTTPAGSPPRLFEDIGTQFPADTGTQEQFRCLCCGRSHEDARGLTRHMRWHDETKRKQCHYCSYTYFKPTDYKRHLKTHMSAHDKKSTSLACTLNCGKTFTRKDNIWRHLHKKHTMTEVAARQFVRANY